MSARLIEFGTKALELACYYQNRYCEQKEIIEMFCMDAQAALDKDAEIAALKKRLAYYDTPGAWVG